MADGAGLARNNIAAFWRDPAWALLWPEAIDLEFLIEQSAKRQPRNLLRNQEFLRHQKAVDLATGDVVGYARWVLPVGRSLNGDGGTPWEEAQVPAVSEDEEMRFTRQAEAAWWKPRSDISGMDDEINAIMERTIADKACIRKLIFSLLMVYVSRRWLTINNRA